VSRTGEIQLSAINGTPLTTNHIRRRLRAVLSDAGTEGVTPHAFRRTVATVLDRASGPDPAAELLGHSSSKITKEHYIEPDEAVDPVTAEILESSRLGNAVDRDEIPQRQRWRGQPRSK
jgi:integrase